MPRQQAVDPFKRYKTRHRGVTYRVRSDGSRAYYVFAGGRQRYVEGGEREALAKQAELRGRAARGERLAPVPTKIKALSEAWYHSKAKLRPGTLRDYRRALDREVLPRFGHLKVGQVKADALASAIRDLEARGLSSSTINNYLLPLSGTLDLAVRRGMIAVNPFSLLTRDERPRRSSRARSIIHVWSDDEIEALVSASALLARQPTARYDYSPLLRVASYTGLRLGELLGLLWEDFDTSQSALHVRRQWTRDGDYGPPKTEAAFRRIPLSRGLSAFLAALRLRSLYSDDADPMFASRNGTPMSHRNVAQRGFEPAAKRAGIEGVSFHDLRHAFASRMISRGITSPVLAWIMGHESASVTERTYIHLFDRVRSDEAVRRAMEGG